MTAAVSRPGGERRDIVALPTPPMGLGESPFWHPDEQALYWIDIPGQALHRFVPASAEHRRWPLPAEPGCIAPLPNAGGAGRLLLAARDGLWRFDLDTGTRERLASPPHDATKQRFNDGKADPQGRLWVGSLCDARDVPLASLYRFDGSRIETMAADATVGNGLAFSPDGRTLYWSDTTSHRIFAFDFDPVDGSISRRREFASFPLRAAGEPIERYGGRPDGAAVDCDGAYWVAMFEGARLLRLSSEGRVLDRIALPVRCPMMPCFGGPDLKTLFVTTARAKRPADELAATPLAGQVLSLRVAVPGLPVNFASV